MPAGEVGPVAWYGSCSMANECSGLWPPYLSALACYPAPEWPREPMGMNTEIALDQHCGKYIQCSAWRKNALGVFAASLGTQQGVKKERHSFY